MDGGQRLVQTKLKNRRINLRGLEPTELWF